MKHSEILTQLKEWERRGITVIEFHLDFVAGQPRVGLTNADLKDYLVYFGQDHDIDMYVKAFEDYEFEMDTDNGPREGCYEVTAMFQIDRGEPDYSDYLEIKEVRYTYLYGTQYIEESIHGDYHASCENLPF